MRKSFLAVMVIVLWAVSARPKIAEAAAAPRFYVQPQNLMGGATAADNVAERGAGYDLKVRD